MAGLADLNEKIPMRRMGQPDEIGRILINLAGDDSSYLTGTTVFINGGRPCAPISRAAVEKPWDQKALGSNEMLELNLNGLAACSGLTARSR